MLRLTTLLVHTHSIAHLLNAILKLFDADVCVVASCGMIGTLHLFKLCFKLAKYLSSTLYMLRLTTLLVHAHSIAHLLNAILKLFDADVCAVASYGMIGTLHLFKLCFKL